MNVFIKDSDLCVGYAKASLENRDVNFIRLITKWELPLAVEYSDNEPVSIDVNEQIYEFAIKRHRYKGENWISETEILVAREDQDLTPLELQQYCQIGWMRDRKWRMRRY